MCFVIKTDLMCFQGGGPVCGSEGVGHPKIKICHDLLIPSPYDFLSSVEHKKRSSEDCADCSFSHVYNKVTFKESHLMAIWEILLE